MKIAAAILLMVAIPSAASGADTSDRRIRDVHYSEGGIVQLATTAPIPQILLFGENEKIESVRLGAPDSYTVTVAGSRDSLLLRVNGRSVLTIMSVRTSQRTYDIELVSGDLDTVPHVVRFSLAVTGREEQQSDQTGVAASDKTTYRMSGERDLRPASVNDDGQKTYISWHERQAVPAIFALGPTGKEEMVDCYVRQGIFTIDRVYDELVFRIDKQSARAHRQASKDMPS